MYSALSVANYIIDYCNSKGRGVSNLKLQKILYFVQAEFLVSTHAPCFNDPIEAWDFGPVVPSVYHKYKIYGAGIIPFSSEAWPSERILDRDKKTIVSMVEQALPYSASQLVEITHSHDPWKNSYIRGYNNIISNESIRAYYEK